MPFIIALLCKVVLDAIRAIRKARGSKPETAVRGLLLRTRAARCECSGCDLLHLWRWSASDEAGCAVLHLLSS